MITYKCYHNLNYASMIDKSIESENEVKIVLKAISSHLRAEILSQLASGPKYALELVKTLGKSQQDIHRNLNYLEKLSIVKSFVMRYEDYRKKNTKPSKGRRYFTIDHSFMLQINLAPNLFELKYQSVPLDHLKIDQKNKFQADSSNFKNVHKKNLSDLSKELNELNSEIKELENHQQAIFYKHSRIRNQIIEQINKNDLSPLQFVVLEKVIGELPVRTEDLAEELNLNLNHLQGILESLQDTIPIKEHKNHWSL